MKVICLFRIWSGLKIFAIPSKYCNFLLKSYGQFQPLNIFRWSPKSPCPCPFHVAWFLIVVCRATATYGHFSVLDSCQLLNILRSYLYIIGFHSNPYLNFMQIRDDRPINATCSSITNLRFRVYCMNYHFDLVVEFSPK